MPAPAAAPVFDPVVYKETTRRQWDEAAEAWDRWGPLLERWLGESTELMLDRAGVRPGARVLDVAAGAGGQTIAAARRVGPDGRVLATDISAGILEYAAREAALAGLANVATSVADGEALDVEAGFYDAVISRLGLIYFPDRGRALAGMVRALRPGGRLSAIVYSTPERNGFFSGPVAIVRRSAQLGPPAPGQPGPFSLGGDGVLAGALRDAGLVDVEVHAVPAPLRMASAAECARFERESFGALHQMLAGLDDRERAHAWDEVAAELARFERADGSFEGPCELLVGAGTKPPAGAGVQSRS
jgi:SAM-dependent methyltransferase